MKTVKVDLITGFLGAGKTTLINKLLDEAYLGEKIAILENEFGAIGIDGDLIEKAGVRITEITNGCICCSLRGALEEGLATICRDFAPDRIVIEPTGLADAEDIATPIEEVAKEYPIAIDRIITIVSTTQYEALLATIGPFIRRQIENAGLIVLSRVEEGDGAKVAAELRRAHPGLPIIAEPWSKISGLTILEAAKPYHHHDHDHDHEHEDSDKHDHDHCHCHAHDHDHHHHHTADDYTYFCAASDRAFSREEATALAKLFSGSDGGEVYRAKGILKGKDNGFRFDYVGGDFSLTDFPVDGEGKFTVIGKHIDDAFWRQALTGK